MASIAASRGDNERAETRTLCDNALKVALEREACGGDGRMRGCFDDGTPLGAARSEERRIDLIALSWEVLSKGATSGRALRAMATRRQSCSRCSTHQSFTDTRRSAPAQGGALCGGGGRLLHGTSCGTWRLDMAYGLGGLAAARGRREAAWPEASRGQDPCLPKAWEGFEVTVRQRSSRYRITIENFGGVSRGA